jgi:hypothetical protein
MGDLVDNEYLWKCTQRAIKILDTVSAQNDALLIELHVTMLNDHGLALLLKGDSVGALRCFQNAVSRLTFSGSSSELPAWLVLPTYFNISLLLLRDGRIDDSAKSWLRVRGHFDIWHMALGGDNDALQSLKSLCVTTINRHGLLIAKRGMVNTAMMLWDQEFVTEWVPPLTETGVVMEDTTFVGGVYTSQITAMDVLLSKYALSTAEKKSFMLFRRSSGGTRY